MKKLGLILILLPSLAGADVTSPSGKTVECYCTDKAGARIELGESICLQVDGRMFTAQCQMSLNSPMWRETQDGCLSGSLAPQRITPFGADALNQPVQTFAVDPEV